MFRGVTLRGFKTIPEEGFRSPALPSESPNPGSIHINGIYFSSSKPLPKKCRNYLLLCKVLLGKVLQQEKADNSLDSQKLKNEGCDSVLVLADSKEKAAISKGIQNCFNLSILLNGLLYSSMNTVVEFQSEAGKIQ